MGKINEVMIETLEDFLKHLEKSSSFDTIWLYRGQARDWPLGPKLYRLNFSSETRTNFKYYHEIERRILAYFQRQALPMLSVVPDHDWDWLALAQHYGLPTRFLDWTTNPLVALYFAVEKDEVKEDSVVWAGKFADNSPKQGEHHYLAGVYLPPHVSPRISAQQGCFVMFSFCEFGEFIPLEDWFKAGEREAVMNLNKFVIPAAKRAFLKRELHRVGVSAFSIYPDLEGLCSDIAWGLSNW